MHVQLTPIVHNSITLNSLHPSIEAEASSQISLLQYIMVFKCFSLCVFSSRLPFPWAQQPGGAAVQHPSPRTLQQGVQQQQLQWVWEQLGVWLREREQLQREWRQQALALLQPRGKGSHSLWFGMAICYYAHSDFFPDQEPGRRCTEPKGMQKVQGSSSWHPTKQKWWGMLGQIKAKETKMKKEMTVWYFPWNGALHEAHSLLEVLCISASIAMAFWLRKSWCGLSALQGN